MGEPDIAARIEEVLGRYPFDDIPAAYQNLMGLATEKIRFLSTRRCRHFLAAIAPRLLAAIAKTPEPDTTLVNLSRVSDSLGGKAALWVEDLGVCFTDADGRPVLAQGTLRVIDDRREAIGHAIGLAREGDVILLAGKGHEQSIIYGTEKRPWDDRTAALEALADSGWSAA